MDAELFGFEVLYLSLSCSATCHPAAWVSSHKGSSIMPDVSCHERRPPELVCQCQHTTSEEWTLTAAAEGWEEREGGVKGSNLVWNSLRSSSHECGTIWKISIFSFYSSNRTLLSFIWTFPSERWINWMPIYWYFLVAFKCMCYSCAESFNEIRLFVFPTKRNWYPCESSMMHGAETWTKCLQFVFIASLIWHKAGVFQLFTWPTGNKILGPFYASLVHFEPTVLFSRQKPIGRAIIHLVIRSWFQIRIEWEYTTKILEPIPFSAFATLFCKSFQWLFNFSKTFRHQNSSRHVPRSDNFWPQGKASPQNQGYYNLVT